jgi:hypothetical protein
MRYIDQKEIYNQTEQGLTIFQYYFPSEDLKNSRKKFKERPSEKSASALVTWYMGLWRITDFGNQAEINGLSAIDYVKWREGFEYYDALRFIEEVIIGRIVTTDSFQKSRFTAEYESREMGPEDKKGEYKFIFKTDPTKQDLTSIGRYVNKETLELFNCRTIQQYEYCAFSKKQNKDIVHIFKSHDTYPMFLFDYGDFKKLYRPLDREKKNRFLYIGQKPKKFIYGLKQIKRSDNEFADQESEDIKMPEDKPGAKVRDLFRCSGESDALNLASLGFHVYWLNSESADFTYDEFKELDDLCESHYQIMDLDSTGRSQALRNAMKYISLYNIELPEWLRLKDDWRGNPCKDLKDFLNISGDDEDQTRYNFLVLKRNARRVKFWWKNNEKGKEDIQINMEFFFFFLRANGFYQMDSIYHKKAGYCYTYVTNNKMVELIHPDDMKRRVKRFTKEWIKSKNLMDGIAILNKINTSAQLTEGNFETIDEIKCSFKNYDRFTEYMHFNNCSIRVTKDKIEKVKHEDVPNYILKSLNVSNKILSDLIDRNMQVIEKPAIEVNATSVYQSLLDRLASAKTDEERQNINIDLAKLPDTEKYTVEIHDKDFIFASYLRDIARVHWHKELEKKEVLTETEKKEEMLSLANIMFVLGYHCSQYKDPGKPWLTFLQDMKISEVGKASGRSGKSILSMAPTKVRISFYCGGRKLNNKDEYKFLYDGVTEFHDFYEIDDYHEFADFGFFYTQVTGKREINPKNYAPFVLDYEDSGKMLISSNYELPNVDSSTLGRLLNCGVSDYYHEQTKFNDYKETRSPLIKFGRRIYNDFTDEEWVKFYNLIAYCIQLQMRFYKIQPPMNNLEKRQLRRAMSAGLGRDEIFFTWANNYFIRMPNGISNLIVSPPEHGYFNFLFLREDAFENFKSTSLTKNQANEYKPAAFKNHLSAWCEYNGFEFNPLDKCTDRQNRRILKTIDSSTRECFYISTLRTSEGIDNEPKVVMNDEPSEVPF